MRTITYTIKRFDGKKSWFQDYQFAYRPGKTILGGLIEIKETLDPTLSFSASCRCAVCGACSVRVNGQAMLACESHLDKVLKRFGDKIIVEPLGNFKVIRDLIVDWDDKSAHLTKAKAWFVPKDEFSAEKGCRQSLADFQKIEVQAGCILCGACSSECNKLTAQGEDFEQPFTYSKIWKFVADSRDNSDAERIKEILAKGLWKCFHCAECITKCPKGLTPMADIGRLRQLSIEMGYKNNPGARHALAFYKDIAEGGRLNEVKLSLRSEGIIGSLAKIHIALRLLRRGKLNLLHFQKKVKSHEQIQVILKAAKEAKE